MIPQQAMRRLPVHRLQHAARRQVRRNTQAQVHVIRPHGALENLHVLPATDLVNLPTHLLPHFAAMNIWSKRFG